MSSPLRRAQSLGQKYLPPVAARLAKRVGVYPRYRRQAAACRDGFRQFGDRYRHPVLFIAGLPKSGTTWLEKMVASYPGYHNLLIPDVAAYELATGGSHDYDLPADMFGRFDQMLILTKMHVHGSPHNAALLRHAGVPYVVLYRDLRDVAVSYVHYVRRTPWHPEYPAYAPLSTEAGLARFGATLLPAYVDWVTSWHAHADPQLGLIVRYEAMLADAPGVMGQVARHFGLDDSAETIQSIVAAHDFATLRNTGAHDDGFFRRGVAGDWRNHFTPGVSAQYRAALGDFLVRFGYESDLYW